MNKTLTNMTHAVQRKAMGAMIDKVLKDLDKDREGEYLKLVDLAQQFYGSGFTDEQYDAARAAIKDPNNKWMKIINSVIDETDPGYAKKMALNLGYEAFLRGTKTIRANG